MEKKDDVFFFKVKKTNELNDSEIDQLLNLVYSTMSEKRTKKDFNEKYTLNFLGYSFHALMIKDSIIVGCNTAIPQEFIFFNKKIIFAQWCETLIDSNYRGNFSNFKKLGKVLDDSLIKNNISFVYGLPNRALYIVSKRLFNMKDIGKLNYYVYPSKMDKFLKKIYPLNIILCLLLKFYMKIKLDKNQDSQFKIHKINNNNFIKGRYQNSKSYIIEETKEFKLVYKIEISKKHNDAKIIWIIDVDPLTNFNLKESINKIKKKNYREDLIIYIGKLKFLPNNLIKIPDKFIEEHNLFSGKILDENKVNNLIFNDELWNINSSNFDYK